MEEATRFPFGTAMANFLWILGAAIILAVISWHEFHVRAGRLRWKGLMKSAGFRRPIYVGLIFIMAGLALSIHSPWIAATGATMAFVFFFFLVRSYL